MRIKRDYADEYFSRYIRKRDKECKRCHSAVQFNDVGLPVSHQASHFFGRAKESTRFDPDNVDTLCHGCHQHWGSADREGYRQFKLTQLGQKEYDSLVIRAGTYKKKDRAMSLLEAKALLKSLVETD